MEPIEIEDEDGNTGAVSIAVPQAPIMIMPLPTGTPAGATGAIIWGVGWVWKPIR